MIFISGLKISNLLNFSNSETCAWFKTYTVKISLFHLSPNLLIPISLTPGNHHSHFLVYLTGVCAKYSLEFLLLFHITVLGYFNRVSF